jgi:hypothetical protein
MAQIYLQLKVGSAVRARRRAVFFCRNRRRHDDRFAPACGARAPGRKHLLKFLSPLWTAASYPMTGIAGCCAHAASGHAAAPPGSPRRATSACVSPLQGAGAPPGVELATLKQGARTDLSPIGEMSQERAAALLNVGKRSVERAREVQARGAPECVGRIVAAVSS